MTVFGESAGGASATYLMMSPVTKGKYFHFQVLNSKHVVLEKLRKWLTFSVLGLFSKAIAQSGTNLAPWAQPAHDGIAPKRATKLAQSFKCYTPDNWTKTIDCLRKQSAENITAAFYDFFEWDTDPMIPFPPVTYYCYWIFAHFSNKFLLLHVR